MRNVIAAVTVSILALSVTPIARAQSCSGSYQFVIPNLHGVSYTAGVSWTIAWDPLPGAPSGFQYDVVLQDETNACHPTTSVVATTTATTAVVPLSASITNFLFYIAAHDDPCKESSYVVWADTFQTAPQKPSAPVITVGNAEVTAVLPSYSDSNVAAVYLERSGSDGKFVEVTGVWDCLSWLPWRFTDVGSGFGGTYLAPALPPGTYQYRFLAYSHAASTTSDPVTVTVGPAAPLAIQSFTATPATVRLGQPVTLAWSTTGAASVMIDNGVGAVLPSGSATVTPRTTTTYTLTAIFGSKTLTTTVTVTVLNAPLVNVVAFPSPILESAGSGGGTASYTLTNSGGTSTAITLSQTGSFFTQTPGSFTLAPGASQTITITTTAQAAGTYDGASIPGGSGVPEGLQIPIQLLSALPPPGRVTADPSASRVDVAAAAASNPTGTVDFTNHGTATLTGILSSDVPWIIPQSGIVTIAPGNTVTLSFSVDRTRRPDVGALIGSTAGNLSLSFLSGSGAAFGKQKLDANQPIPSVSLVKIVDTVQSPVSTGGIPAIAAGEIALFVPGVRHGAGNKALQFASDVSILNSQNGKSSDVTLYYTTVSGSATAAKSAALPSVPPQVDVAVADVVKTQFSGGDEVGSLQIRSRDAASLAVSASVLTAGNPTGTFGNTIPVLRSDRSIAANDTLVLTGLRKDATTTTDIFLQETAGAAATAHIDFLGADGSTVSSADVPLDAFKMARLADVVPPNAVTAMITNSSAGAGQLAAYATPTDQVSGDTWSIVDWVKQLAYDSREAVIVPVAGTVHGANGTLYRTDISVTNRGTSSASGTLRFVSRAGQKIDRQLSLGGKQTQVVADVVSGLFNVSGDSTGYVLFTPVTGSFAISARAYTTTASGATFGTGIPVLAVSSALSSGGSRFIAALADSTRSAVVERRPGTFRTNFGLAETTGQTVTVRVTFRFDFPAGAKAQGIGAQSRDYVIGPYQFLMFNSIAGEILGPDRLQYGDLANAEADFQVISGKGAVVLFTSSVDNATGDSILRTE